MSAQLTPAAQEQIGQASQALLNHIADCAKAQYDLLEVRKNREASSEAIAGAATKYRQAEGLAQEALSTLLNYWVVVFEAQAEGKQAEDLRPQAAPTPPEVWRSRNKQ